MCRPVAPTGPVSIRASTQPGALFPSRSARLSTPAQRCFATRRPVEAARTSPTYQQALELARGEQYDAARAAFAELVAGAPSFTKAWVSWAQVRGVGLGGVACKRLLHNAAALPGAAMAGRPSKQRALAAAALDPGWLADGEAVLQDGGDHGRGALHALPGGAATRDDPQPQERGADAGALPPRALPPRALRPEALPRPPFHTSGAAAGSCPVPPWRTFSAVAPAAAHPPNSPKPLASQAPLPMGPPPRCRPGG